MRNVRTISRMAMALAIALALLPSRAVALERLCDTAYENCRTPLLTLIKNEKVGIDVAFWFMTDSTVSSALISRWKAGIPIRVLMDSEARINHPGNVPVLAALKSAGIPMREKTAGGILHWKTMIFYGQNTVEFSGANFTASEFIPAVPYQNYDDEVIMFTHDPKLVGSFKKKYDDVWATKTGYSNYANVTTLARQHPVVSQDPELNFPPSENYRTRAVARYTAETAGIDVNMFRITDRAHADAMIAAHRRGVKVRLITDPSEYRNPDRVWHSYNVDRMYVAGIPLKMINHAGLNHEKLVLLKAQDMAIFGSSNWSSPSAAFQLEHNIFTKRQHLVDWFRAHWNRKWNNTGPYKETKNFTPLGPNVPRLVSPASGAAVSTTVRLKWYGGRWAHKYDVYVGTSSGSMTKVVSNRELGPSITNETYQSVSISSLKTNTTYYWKIVGKTMANKTATSVTRSFTT